MAFPRLQGRRQADVVVIGGGIAGVVAALELERQRLRVVLLEAGALSAGTDVGHLRVGAGTSYREAAERYGRDVAREVWEHHRSSRDGLERWLATAGQDAGYRRAGGFRLAETRAEAAALAESEELLREDGFSGEFFDHHMLEARFDLRGYAGGYWAADDAELEPEALVRALAGAARAGGATVHEASQVKALELSASGAVASTESGRVEADWAVVAAGCGSGSLLGPVARRIAPRAERQLRRPLPPGAALPGPGTLRAGTLSWRVGPDGVRVAGPRPEDFAHGPALAGPGRAAETARGQRAVSLDGLPLVGRLGERRAWLACGFAGAGLGLAFACARWLVQDLSGRDSVPGPFRADRVFATAP